MAAKNHKWLLVWAGCGVFLMWLYYSDDSAGDINQELVDTLRKADLYETDVITALRRNGVTSQEQLVAKTMMVSMWLRDNNSPYSGAIAKLCADIEEMQIFKRWMGSHGLNDAAPVFARMNIRNSQQISKLDENELDQLFEGVEDAMLKVKLKAAILPLRQEQLADFTTNERRLPTIGSLIGIFWLMKWIAVYLMLSFLWFIGTLAIGWLLSPSQKTSFMNWSTFWAKTWFVACFPFLIGLSLIGKTVDVVHRLFRKSSVWRRRRRDQVRDPGPMPDPPSNHSVCKQSWHELITGNYLDRRKSRIEHSWTKQSEWVVGSSMTLTVKAVCRNSLPYSLKAAEDVHVTIEVDGETIPCSTHLSSKHLPSVTDSDEKHLASEAPAKADNLVDVTFFTRRAGVYRVAAWVEGQEVGNSPLSQAVLPGPVDAQYSSVRDPCCLMAVRAGLYRALDVQLRDCYGNNCRNADLEQLCVEVFTGCNDSDSGKTVRCDQLKEKRGGPGIFEILYLISQEGLFQARVNYAGKLLQNGEFTVVALSDNEKAKVDQNVQRRSLNKWYDAKLVVQRPGSVGGDRLARTTTSKVYIYLSPRQVTIKEFYFAVIPRRLYTFRVCPSTKISCGKDMHGLPHLEIDDGCQPQVQLLCKERNVVVGTYAELLHKSIGGSETFADKRKFFYHELEEHHKEYASPTFHFTVHRNNLLESAKTAVHGKEWRRKWYIHFAGEEGMDYGGVSREFFHLLSSALFDPATGLFTRFKDDTQGLVHPNPRRPAHLKLDYYKFAGRIVGKCLLSSARGKLTQINVRLTRSLLAQLIGLRVNYKYFETDDPDLYTTKVQHILHNDVEDLEMVFAEEEYSDSGQLLKTEALVSGGESMAVTNDNKIVYLDALAQYRLAKRVQSEVEMFMKGLNDIVPDNLLSIFDEHELELLMCGSDKICLDDLRKHSIVTSRSHWFERKVVPWFWVIVSSFTQDELARLVQFTTGTSQLPPDGFAELKPQFQISPAPVRGSLPTSHTCFNQLCLPDFDSCEDLQRALVLAINEGSEGFGMI